MKAKSVKLRMLLTLASVVILMATQTTFACTSIPVTPGASVDGSSMTTHNDDSTTDDFHIKIVREKDWTLVFPQYSVHGVKIIAGQLLFVILRA